ncbi:MAG: DUF488 domain-containing protein [Acidobacteria bacterium]|nr:DUF488 domain-containing protein [Acidobacteriota bacterium]
MLAPLQAEDGANGIVTRGLHAIHVKRVYEPPAAEDGVRLLVDRLWPRGVQRKALPLDGWLKDVAPSDALRRWYAHDPARWNEFRRRYFAELDGKPQTWQPILEAVRKGNVTLLYSARDPTHNNAVALRGYLMARRKGT